MIDIIFTVVIGAVVGLIAKFLVPGKDPGGFIVTPAIGIGGAFLATFLGQSLGFYEIGQTAGFIGSVVGAVIILLIYRMVRRRAGIAPPS